MRSHVYDYSGRDLLRAVWPTLAVFVACVAALHFADWTGWLPPRPAALHADETGLRHQAKACHSQHPARIVFVGDSTCLAGVDPVALSNELPGRIRAINLSLILTIDLGSYAEATADFAAANPGNVSWVVLLVCPDKLSGRTEAPAQIELWRRLREEYRDRHDRRGRFWDWTDPFGRLILRDRLAVYLLPEAVRGRGAAFFGFTKDIDDFMTAHDGAVLDFGEGPHPPPQNFCRWTVEKDFEPGCRSFRDKLPPGAKLAIGLTPTSVPGVPPGGHAAYVECLRRWNEWMHADLVLSNLPAALPTSSFAPGGHLNATGQKEFTSAVARELAPELP